MTPDLTPEEIANLLQPYLTTKTAQNSPAAVPDWSQINEQLALYLQLILKWNARTNLTAIRSPADIVRRHFGESLFVGSHLGECSTLLDFGSGAGFPGIPIQLLRPDIKITLAESQGKKASFLREVTRNLALATEIWPARVETMPKSKQFHTVTLRAVDNMEAAIQESINRASHSILILGTRKHSESPVFQKIFQNAEIIPIPNSTEGVLLIVSQL